MVSEVRCRGKAALASLLSESLNESEGYIPSWIDSYGDGNVSPSPQKCQPPQQQQPKLPPPTSPRTPRRLFFDRHGFSLIKSFSSADEVSLMKAHMCDLVESQWDPSKSLSSFRTDHQQGDAQGRDDYFLTSADKVHFFIEPEALTSDGGELKNEYQSRPKIDVLNKVGHGLHIMPGPFQEYSISGKVSSLVRELGWRHPVIPQSMYIFKHAHIGGSVTSHQDASFLYTTPRQSCLGLWLALDDATVENGCLWVRPDSHYEPVRRRYVRSNQSVMSNNNESPKCVLEWINPDTERRAPWEGSLPDNSWPPPCDGLFTSGFIPVECNAGDLLVFVGSLDHVSLPNYSGLERHTFQLHLVEGNKAGVLWDSRNWLQYPEGKPFVEVPGP